jgi:hypothetical protein
MDIKRARLLITQALGQLVDDPDQPWADAEWYELEGSMHAACACLEDALTALEDDSAS